MAKPFRATALFLSVPLCAGSSGHYLPWNQMHLVRLEVSFALHSCRDSLLRFFSFLPSSIIQEELKDHTNKMMLGGILPVSAS
jgi:hypothetical protein